MGTNELRRLNLYTGLMMGDVDMARNFQKFGTVQVPEEQLDDLKRKLEKQGSQDKSQ